MTTDNIGNHEQNSIHTYLAERFKKNLAAFHAYATNIAEMFKNYVPRKSINFFYTKDGIPNVVFNDSDKPLYKTENPIKYIEEGDIESLGKMLTKAQSNFDKYVSIHSYQQFQILK